ncbi:MAG: extracellular solute-binding protein [Desulfobacterales bacterium]
MSKRLFLAGAVLTLWVVGAAATTLAGEPSYGLSYYGDLKYPEDFPYFDHVNPDAPKGGRLRSAVIGTFNNLHPYVDKGVPAICVNIGCMLIYDMLLKPSGDELWSSYGNLAESVELADDYSWVAFTLREGIYWHDGVPMTVDDVIWTFNAIKTIGSVGWKLSYKDFVSVEQTGPRSFKFHFSKHAAKTPQLAMHIAAFWPLPKHYWENRKFDATTLEPPLGSGPYRITAVDPGHKVVYERVEDYWGKDLNVNIGYYNIDTVEYLYFLDRNVVIQALKAHVFDYKWENNAKDYATAYDFDGFRKGLFKKERRQLRIPYGMNWGILLNTRKEKLSDIRVREALSLAYNFEWSDRVLWYGANSRNISYFMGSAMSTTGLPTDAERTLLEPFRDQVPDRVFTHAFTLPENNPYGRNRDTLLQADALLEAAGWVVEDFKRVNVKTGEPFTLSLLADSVVEERNLIPYVDNLKRLGITSRLRRVESSQSVNRMRRYDFEATIRTYWQNDIPFSWTMRSRFMSHNANRLNMENYAGINEPAVDFLTKRLIGATTEEEMNTAGKALDRVLLWKFYMIPGGYPEGRRFVYWDRFGFPPPDAGMKWTGFHHLWWFDAKKSARVDAGITELEEP